MFVALTFGYGFYYVCRLSLNVVKKPLVDGGVFTPSELGSIGAALFASYAVGKLVNGILADHVNVRVFVSLGLLASGLINLTMGLFPLFGVFLVAWGLNGWFQSMGAPMSVVALSHWYAAKSRGSAYGIWSTSHNIGEAITYVVVAVAASTLGCVWGFRLAGIVGVICAVLLFIFVRERPSVYGIAIESARNVEHQSVTSRQMAVLKNKGVWLLALSSAFFYVTRYAVSSWGVFYLQEQKHYSTVQAGSIISVSAIAGIAGTFFSGIISDRFFGGRRNIPALIFGLMYVGSTALFLYGPSHVVSDVMAMIFFGISMGGLLVYLGGLMAIDLCGPQVAGAAMGVVGVASYLGAALQDIISGYVIQAGKSVVAGTLHYNFGPASFLWLGAAVASTILALFSRSSVSRTP